jgi:lipid-A-disaccharide synthase-like uncharacterized protein
MINVIRTHWVFGLGFFAQTLFGFRILVQWWLAEKKKQVVSPSLFWNLSLAGSTFFLIYGILRHDLVIIIGQVISYFIYVRNLQLKEDWRKFPLIVRIVLVAIPFISVAFISVIPREEIFQSMLRNKGLFFFLGVIGQLLLNFRFLYQLYYSERLKKSILPAGFWWISLWGSALMVVYAVYRRDPVLLVAQGMAIIPYLRNIVLMSKSHRQHA